MMRIPALAPILLALLALMRPRDVVFAYPPTQAPACTTASPGPDPSGSVCISDVLVYTDANSSSNRFSVSWVSDSPVAGQVKLVGGGSFNDTRGVGFAGTTHYVQLNGLQSHTLYQFDIVSGGNTYTNNGQHWSVDIGPALTPSPPDNILGLVKNPDGSDATEAVVYVTIQRADGSGSSSLLSQVMDNSNAGYFQVSLSDARTTDYSSRFSYNRTGDKLTVTAIGPGGSVTCMVKTGDPRPGHPLYLILGSGACNASTATPSPIPPTSTPTPVTPTATQTLPPVTATVLAATQTATSLTPTPTETALAFTPTFTRVPPAPTAPRATATRQLFIEPTLTEPLITIAPAATASAELTLASAEEATSEPSIPRIIRLATATPGTSSAFAGIVTGGSIFAFLAVVAFVGAAILGVAALYVWKK